MNEATKKLMFSSETDDWATPQALFDSLNDLHGPLELDVCADPSNAKCERYFSIEDDGLDRPWAVADDHVERPACCWMNPPYGRHNGGIGAWVKKAYDESQNGCLVVCLLPVRTDTRWFHDYVLGKGEVTFIKGRIKFGNATTGAPFPSMVVVFYPFGVKPPKNVRPDENIYV